MFSVDSPASPSYDIFQTVPMNIDIMTFRVRVGCHCAKYSCTKVTKQVCVSFYVMFTPFISFSLLLSIYYAITMNYKDFVKCLHCTVGIGMMMQPGVAHNDPLKYLILILLLSGDVAENPGPVAEYTVKNLSVCHVNTQSIYNKLDLIAVELSKYDVITVSETDN